MSEEQHHDDDAEHESAIKTPKQLVTVIAAAIIVPVIVIIMLTQFVTLDNKESPGSSAYAASSVAARIAPVASDAVRPGGIACPLKACDRGAALGNCGNLRLVLTEFADPQGKCIYFRLPDPSETVADELLR